MAYNHITRAQLKDALSRRLGDVNKTFWIDDELNFLTNESLRTFGLCSGFWRARGSITLSASTAFFDLTTLLSSSLLTSTVTDRDLIKEIQYALLESTSTQTSWPGTAQFTYNDVVNAIRTTRNQFLADTGILLTRSTPAVASPAIGRQDLDEDIIDVRRAAFRGASPFDYYTTLWWSDERELTSADPSWATEPGTPKAWSVMGPPPLQMQLAPHPIASGTLDLLTVDASPDLTPDSSNTVIGIPDDLTPAIKWGALRYLLSISGQAQDVLRAEFASRRYDQYVELARLLSCVITADIGGIPIIPETLYNLDAAVPDWQNYSGIPTHLALAGWNMLACYPVPDSNGPYSAALDVVRKTPVPTTNAEQIQIGREQVDAILDYAEHLALFKVGGAEFASTLPMADSFLKQCVTYNQRLSANAKYIFAAKETGQREKAYRIRRQQSDGLGALPSVQEAQSFVAGNAPIRMKRN